MPEFHAEPYLHLAGLSHHSALINRVPMYPCIGNHDTAETEDRDDREQLLDNMYLRERMASDEASGRASMDPGLFYRFRYGRDVEFIVLGTSKEGFFRGKRLFAPGGDPVTTPIIISR